jgi:putative tryptophan/tyrosine transport system substrate-binding protein
MRRGEFIAIAGAGAAYAWSGAVRAQSQKMLRIGMVSVLPRKTPFMDAFVKRMRELGYEDGRNLAIEYVKIAAPAEYPDGMKELIRRQVDVIIAQGPEVTLQSAMAATDKLPIVMIAIDYDPFARGYVTSLARPTGNVTGIFFQQIELSAKRLEIAKQLIPGLQSAAVFWDSGSADQYQSLNDAGRSLEVNLFAVEMRDPPYNYEAAWERVPIEFRSMLILPTSGVFYRDRQQIADFTVKRRIPAIFAFREWVDAGGRTAQACRIYSLTQPNMWTRSPTEPHRHNCRSSSRQSSSLS